MDIKELVRTALPEAIEAAQNLSRLKGFNLKSLTGVLSCVKWAVKRAQTITGLTGEEKKQFVVELVLQVVPMPFWMLPIVNAVLPIVIDVVVDALKDKF